MIISIPKIVPVFPLPGFPYFQSLWQAIEILVEQVVYKLNEGVAEPTHLKLEASLPIVTWFPLQKLPAQLPIILVNKSHERFSNGTGRYFIDMINRFALPGHYLSIESSMTVDFYFEDSPEKKFGLSHIGLKVTTSEEWRALQKNLSKVAEEIRLTVRAVYEARRIVSLKHLKEGEKALLMREQFSSIWERDSKEFELNLFDQVQQWLTKALAEDKSVQLWAEILPRLRKEERISFDRDMFLEIQALLFVYRDAFVAKRRLQDLAKLVCYQYFFKKKLQRDLEKEPFKRHVYLKIFKILHPDADETGAKHALGISVGVNLLNRYELLDVHHILAAVHAFLPQMRLIPHSYFVDARHQTMRFYYLEVDKGEDAEVNEYELKLLKTRLAQELGERIEIVNHPLFLPCNEEELLKYVAILSKELNEDDIPQVVITFNRQSQEVFSFYVIVLRHVSDKSVPLRELLEKACPSYRWIEEQIKRIKSSKIQRHKEACILRVVLPKVPFFRKDFSLDLDKARAAIGAVLSEAIGEYRDYNGGSFEARHHAFATFKEGFPETETSFLERFFYGIEPAFMQMVLHGGLLKEGYALFKNALHKEFDTASYVFEHVFTNQGLIVTIASPYLKSTDPLFQEIFSLTHCFPSIAFCPVWVGRIFIFTLFHSTPDAFKQRQCFDEIHKALQEKLPPSIRVHAKR